MKNVNQACHSYRWGNEKARIAASIDNCVFANDAKYYVDAAPREPTWDTAPPSPVAGPSEEVELELEEGRREWEYV